MSRHEHIYQCEPKEYYEPQLLLPAIGYLPLAPGSSVNDQYQLLQRSQEACPGQLNLGCQLPQYCHTLRWHNIGGDCLCFSSKSILSCLSVPWLYIPGIKATKTILVNILRQRQDGHNFCKPYFYMHFLEWKLLNFKWTSIEICSSWFNWQ